MLSPSKHLGHFINGALCQSLSGETFDNINPATAEIISHVARGRAADIDAAVAAAKAALPSWSSTDKKYRADILTKVSAAILENVKVLAEMESLDTGKPISETLEGDIPRSAANFRFFAELLRSEPSEHLYPSEDGSKHKAYRIPIGVSGLITPWNLPLHLATWKIAPALAMGNTIVLKPAELTPTTATALCQIAKDCGLPDGVLNVVHGFGEHEAGEALVKHHDVACISFTGETTTGKAIMRTASDTLKKVSFELGGKGASVVFPDADIAKAVTVATRAAFRNQGQICLAGSRLLVHESIADSFVNKVLDEVAKIRVGDPLDASTTMGALISVEHRDRVKAYISLARKEGATILCGGEEPQNTAKNTAFLAPTIITGVSQQSRLIQEEIFGPVLTVQTFADLDEALTLVNGTRYGLSCSVWTQDDKLAERFCEKADFGLVWVNTWFLRNLGAPFGGVKASGIGREGGLHSFDFFSEWKTISRP